MNDPLDLASSTKAPDSADPSSVAPIPEALRDEVRKVAMPQIQQAFGFQVGVGPPPNVFLEKLSPTHIDKVLDYTKEDRTQEHWRQITFYIIGVIGFLVLCGIFLYADKSDVLEKIIAAFIGFAGGFGVGKWSGKK